MYTINKTLSIREYLTKIKKSELNKLYNTYRIYSNKQLLEKYGKEIIIEMCIKEIFLDNLDLYNDNELKDIKNLLENDKIDDISNVFITNNYIFINGKELIIPKEILNILKKLDIDELSKKNKLIAIEFYLNINGVLSIDKIQNILEEIELYITKEDLTKYLKEQNYIIYKNYVFLNKEIYDFNQEYNIIKIKEAFKDYAIYDLSDIKSILENKNDDELIFKMYNNIKDCIKDKVECFKTAYEIYNYIIYGYNYEEVIQKLISKKNLKGTSEKLIEFNKIIQEIYDTKPSFIYNGFYINMPPLSDWEEELYNHIDIYLEINGAIKINILLDILNNNHGYALTKADILNFIRKLIKFEIINDSIAIRNLNDNTILELLKEKTKISKYKILDDIDIAKLEIEKTKLKLRKLINKCIIDEEIEEEIILAVTCYGISKGSLEKIKKEYNLSIPENKQRRLYKDLLNNQKDVRHWYLNGHKQCEI